MIQNPGDLLGGIEPAAVGIHVENDRGRATALGGFLGPAEEDREGGIDLAMDWHQDHGTRRDFFLRGSCA